MKKFALFFTILFLVLITSCQTKTDIRETALSENKSWFINNNSNGVKFKSVDTLFVKPITYLNNKNYSNLNDSVVYIISKGSEDTFNLYFVNRFVFVNDTIIDVSCIATQFKKIDCFKFIF